MAAKKSARRLLPVVLVGLLGVGILPAGAYQVPSAPFSQGESASATLPGSGLTQTISVGGRTELLDETTAGARGITATTYSPAIAGTTPAQDLAVDTGNCAATGSCGDRGTVTIKFSQPVRNPILHLAGIGGAATKTVNGKPGAQSELHAVLRLTTAGLSLKKVGAGNNLLVTPDTITAANHNAGPNCTNRSTGSGAEAGATAACGSVQVNGVTTSISFDLTAVFTKNAKLPAFNHAASGDAFSVVASLGEDFGDAPSSYGAAWSVLGDLRLGPEATEDNATVANGTTGPTVADQADDGLTFKPLLTTAKTYSVPVALTGTTRPGRACGWIDLDRSGTFQQSERACSTFAAGQSAATLTWSDLAGLKPGTAYGRVRVGSTTAQVEKPTGAGDTGEVEDHPFAVVPPPPPVLADDKVATAFNTGVTTEVLRNDKPGDPSTPLQPETVCVVDGDKCQKMVTIIGRGIFRVTAAGAIDFQPVPGFVGVVGPLTYRVADSNGTTGAAKLTVTVALPAAPVANPDIATTPQNVSRSVNLLGNDRPAPGVTLVTSSVVLRDPADGAFKKKVAVPGEGATTVRPNGTVDFVPLPQFTGVATTLGYQVTDSTGQLAESTLAITVTPVTPRAAGDSVTTPFDTNVVIAVLDNDLPGSPDAPLNPASLKLVSPTSGELVDKLTVARQGVFVVGDGKATFQPETGFRGATTPITYQVQDKNGTAARAPLTVAVDAPGPPVANPDTVTTLQGGLVYIPVLANDKPGPTGSPLIPDSVRLIPPTKQGDPVQTVVVPGQGKYTAKSDGRILFEPVPSFSGKATPIGYQVADGNEALGGSTLAVEVTRVQPDATDDTASTAYDTNVTVAVLGNDEAGDPAVPLVPSTVRLLDPRTQEPKATVTVAGVATYTARPDGKVDVDPLPTYTGVAAPVRYRVSDVNGTIATATLTLTVAKPAAPVAKPDVATSKQDVSLSLDPLVNDEAGAGTGLDPLSLVLIDPADGSLKKAIKVAGQGAYQVKPDGTVAFDPLPAFTGTATPVVYRVSDWFDQAARSTITVNVTAVTPVAADDAGRTPYDTVATVRVLANDKAGDPSAPLLPGSLLLRDPADGLFKPTVTILHEGTYTARAGVVVFDPAAAFTGPGTALSYQVADDNGTVASASVQVTVGAAPIARPDRASTLQDVTVSVNLLSNDSPGTDAKLDPASVVLADPAAVGALPASGASGAPAAGGFGKVLTVPGQGTYTVQPTGAVVFDPLPTFRGPAKPVTYQVADSNRSTARSTLGMTVTPVVPVTVDDSAITAFNKPITVPVLSNDRPGDASAPLLPASVQLKDPADGTFKKQLTVPGEGNYSVGPDGAITFSPVKDYQGVTTPATYRVADDNGTTADGLLLLTVGKGPEAKPDTGTTKQNVKLTVDPLVNDKPGTAAELTKTSVQVFDGKAWGRAATIPGQGTYRVDKITGKVAFDPVSTFSGIASIAYQVTDTSGNKAASTVSVTVTPIVPVATDDKATTAFDTPITVPVLANDKPGDPSAPLARESVRLIDPATGDPVSTLRVAGQGTYTVQPDGGIRLVPEGGSSGTATPVTYQVSDTNGTASTATLTVTVDARPVARPDTAETKQHQPITIDPLVNDRPGPGASFDPASLLLVNPFDGALVDKVTVPGEGDYVVAAGKITFTPLVRFTGSTRPTAYEVKDSNRNPARATVSVTVVPVRPEAVDDSATTGFGQAVVVVVLGNDKAGDPSAALVPSSVVLRDPADGTDKSSVTIPAEGAFVARPDGTVGYTPAKGFTGTTRSLTYRVTDANGTSDTARLEITVGAPGEAKATPDSGTGSPGNPVVVNPLLNDTATPGAVWDPGSVCLLTGPATCGKRVVVPAVGVWTVGDDGTIRLVPERGFSGLAKQAYRVTDTNGVAVNSQLRLTIGAKPPAAGQVGTTELPDTGGPSVLLLTLGTLLAALGLTLVSIARRGRRE